MGIEFVVFRGKGKGWESSRVSIVRFGGFFYGLFGWICNVWDAGFVV